ncbi:hypothetical protein [Corynebacterium phoceense]|uniref:hypothetical protein n=1 Tax=Corynebacterium phoceense TaxID=1686286 RepID=UPI00211C184D|nr:hypothetical protein [Corynebacterium phoceense]MCQ9345312.1 hypothetical protein [Corynebacterium phoceense]
MLPFQGVEFTGPDFEGTLRFGATRADVRAFFQHDELTAFLQHSDNPTAPPFPDNEEPLMAELYPSTGVVTDTSSDVWKEEETLNEALESGSHDWIGAAAEAV